MEVFFFGPASDQRLGVYHPANPGNDRLQGVVLCYPFGQEYMRSHRAFRQLAALLAQKGFHVLRFDYRGTGDSARELEDVSPEDWLADIDLAMAELRDRSGVQSVSLVGLRLGALLAAQVASRLTSKLASLVLWDPLISGRDYLKELKGDSSFGPTGRTLSNFADKDGSLHFNGFTMSGIFQEGLNALSLSEMTPKAGRILQVVSHETPGFSALAEHWREGPGFEYAYVSAAHDWNYVDHVGGIMLPQPVLNKIADWL